MWRPVPVTHHPPRLGTCPPVSCPHRSSEPPATKNQGAFTRGSLQAGVWGGVSVHLHTHCPAN